MRDAYFVEYRRVVRGGRWLSAGEYRGTTSATIDYLVNGVQYEVRVAVFNTEGEAVAGPKRATPARQDTRNGYGDGNGQGDGGDRDGQDGEGDGDGGRDEDRDGDRDEGEGDRQQDGDGDGQQQGQGDGDPDPKRPPTAARGLTLTPGDEKIEVSWSAPSDIGEPGDWIGYVVEIREVGERSWFEDGFYKGTTATIDYLENGTTYQVRVIAFNLWGQAATTPMTATPG